MAHNIPGGLQLLDITGVRVGVVVGLAVVAKIIPLLAAPLSAAALSLNFNSVIHCITFLKYC